MRILIFLIAFLIAECLHAQHLLPQRLKSSAIPTGIRFRGNIHEAWQWKDKLGTNILLTSLLGPYRDTTAALNEEDETKELFAYHFVLKNNEWKLLWKMNDLVRACGLDMTVEFIPGSTTITDLDKDSIAETTVQYALGCAGDVSPPDMKLIMHEDTVKYALRGAMWSYLMFAPGKFTITEKDVNLEKLPGYKGADEDYLKTLGRYRTEKEFKNAPTSFLKYARSQWLKFAQQKQPD